MTGSGLRDQEAELSKETEILEQKQATLNDTTYKLNTITSALNGSIGQSVGVLKEEGNAADFATGMQREMNRVLGVQLDTRKQLANYVLTGKQTTSEKDLSLLNKLDRDIELIKVKDKEKRAGLQAYYDAKDAGASDTTASAASAKAEEKYRLTQADKDATKSAKDAESQAKKNEAAQDAINKKIDDAVLKNKQLQAELNGTATGTVKVTEESAKLQAQRELGDKADRRQIERLAQEILKQKVNLFS